MATFPGVPNQRLSFAQLEGLWRKAGGSAALAPIMAAISLAESGGNTASLNNTASTGDYSVGLWQINYYGNLYGSRSARYGTPAQLAADPLAQAKAAVSLAAGGRGLSNWTTYTSGAYRGYLSGAPPAVYGGGLQGSRGARPSAGGDAWSGILHAGESGLISGVESIAPVGVFGAVWSALGGGGSSIGGALHDIAETFKLALWLLQPKNWLRLFEAGFGVALMLFSIYLFGKAATAADDEDVSLAGIAGRGVKRAGQVGTTVVTRGRASTPRASSTRATRRRAAQNRTDSANYADEVSARRERRKLDTRLKRDVRRGTMTASDASRVRSSGDLGPFADLEAG